MTDLVHDTTTHGAEAHIDVRRLGPDDAPAALAAARVFARTPTERALQAFLRTDGAHLLLAYLDDAAVGYAQAEEFRRLDEHGPTLLVLEMLVAPEARRRGVGRALIEALKRLCRERQVRRMLVLADAAHPAPLGLFASTGGIQRAPRNAVYEYDFGAQR